MQHTTHTGSSTHKSLRKPPDARSLAHRLTYQPNQLVGRNRLIVAHMINTTLNTLLNNQLLHYKANIINRAKRTQILIRPQWPRNTPAHHTIQQVKVTLITRTMNHARPQYKNPLITITWQSR